MNKKSPSHRFLRVQELVEKKKQPPSDVREKELHVHLSGQVANPETVRAHDVYVHAYKRETLEAFILVGTPDEDIEGILGLPQAITALYRFLFFDPEVFEDELDRISYAHEYDRNKYGGDLKQFAVDLGRESLKIRFSRDSYKIPSEMAQNNVRATSYMMMQQAKANPNNTEIAREARAWAQVCLKASDASKEVQITDDTDLVVALEEFDATANEETSNISKEKIMH